MAVRLIQPPPTIDSSIAIPEDRLACHLPLRFVKYRYSHHAAASGYDRVCDYIDAPVVRLSQPIYWLGETALRPALKLVAQRGGRFEYSRYDGSMELEVLLDMARRRNQIYHFIYAEKSFYLSAMMAGRRGHKFVATAHHPTAHHNFLFSSSRHFKLFSHVITMDRVSVPIWEEITGRQNVTWIPYGVDTDYFRPCPTRGADGERFGVGFAGFHERDFDTLCDVVCRVCAAEARIEFHLIGRDERLAALARANSNVALYSDVDDETYRTILQGLDLLFLPLKMSTVCNAVLEALACGVPVVTTRGGIEDYLDEASAVVANPGDSDAMASAILREAGPVEGRRLSKIAARDRALTFSWRTIAERHLKLFERVAG